MALPLFVSIDLLSQSQLPVTLFQNHLLFLGDYVIHPLELLVEFLSTKICVAKTILHDRDVFLEGVEVVSEHG